MLRVVSCQVHVKVMGVTIRLSLELGYFLCVSLLLFFALIL